MAGLTRPKSTDTQYTYKDGEYGIFEDKTEQDGTKRSADKLNTPKQQERGKYYSEEYFIRKAEVDANATDWGTLEDMYACKRIPYTDDPKYPCSFVPLVTPCVEGQVAAIIESGIEYTHVTDVPSHQTMMMKLDAASEYIRRRQNAPQQFKDYARYYDLLGNCWLTISWEKGFEKSKTKPNGFPRLAIPPLRTVFPDGRIKDYKDLQYSEYIIHEIGFMPILWARDEYGDELADALASGGADYQGSDPDISHDDAKSFTLLHVWTRNNPQKNLQLIEMDTTGLILRESDPAKPYYKGVGNEYPFWFGRMIPVLGSFYGYGDGRILAPMQDTVNKLTDELELAARFSAQSKIIVDPKARMDVEQLDSDPSTYAVAENPNQNIMQLQGSGVNSVIREMIEFLLREAQRATRFSDVMTGQAQQASATATAVNSQLVQGSVGIKDKKTDIAQAMEWADRYSLKLCLANWSKPFWARLAADYAEYIDAEALTTAPAAVPLTAESTRDILDQKLPELTSIPTWEAARDKDGSAIMTDIDFDVKVVLGNAIPKGRTDMYNILLGLAQLQVMDENGNVKPLVTAKRLTELMEQTLGLKLQTAGQSQQARMAQMVPPTAVNPTGASGAVQMPTGAMATPPPDNLFMNMPQQPNGDPRRMQV